MWAHRWPLIIVLLENGRIGEIMEIHRKMVLSYQYLLTADAGKWTQEEREGKLIVVWFDLEMDNDQ